MPGIYLRFEVDGAQSRRRSPALEQLLRGADPATTVADWRAEAQRVLLGQGAVVLDVAPAVAFQDRDLIAAPPAAHVFLVSALHARASMSSVSVPHDGRLPLTEAEAKILAWDFNHVFGAGESAYRGESARFAAGRGGRLYCLFDVPLRAQTSDPQMLMGRDLWDFRPRGADASRLARLGSEIEMWLFEHAVNRDRLARGQAQMTVLWLWGGGPILETMPPAPFELLGNDEFFSAWAGEGSSASRARLVVCHASPGQDEFEQCAHAVLREAGRELRRGAIDAVYLSAGRRSVAVRRMPRRILFRRDPPWWEIFDDTV